MRQIALTAAREGAGGDPSASARFVVVVSFRVCFVSFCFLPFSSPHVPRAHSSCPLGRGVLMHIPGCDFLRGASLAPALPSPLCLCSVLDAAEAYSGMRILAGGTPRAAFVGLCYSYIYIVNTVHYVCFFVLWGMCVPPCARAGCEIGKTESRKQPRRG